MTVKLKNYHYIIFAALLILAGTLIRLWNLDAGSLWYDEYLTYTRASSSFDYLVKDLSSQGNQLPLYYLMLYLFPTQDDLQVRYPSVLAGMLGIALMIGITRRLYRSPSIALAAGAMIAFSPYHIWLSRNARVYPLVFVASLLVSYFFLRILTDKHPTWRTWAAFAVSSMIAYQTHQFTLLLPVTQFIMLVLYLHNDRGCFWRWVAVQAIAGSLFLAWIIYQSQQPNLAIAVNWIPDPGLQDIPLTVWNMSVGYPLGTFLPSVAGFALALGLIMWGSIITVLKYRDMPQRNYWLLQFWMPLIIVFGISITLKPAYVDRYFVFILPALIMLLVWGIAHVPHRMKGFVLTLIILVMGANIVREFARGDYIRAEWDEVTEQIECNCHPDEALLMTWHYRMVQHYAVAPPQLDAMFERVMDHNQPGFSLPPQMNAQSPSTAWVAIHIEREDIHRIGHMPEYDPFNRPDDPLSPWLAAHRAQIIGSWHYNNVWLFRVRLDESSFAVSDVTSPAEN